MDNEPPGEWAEIRLKICVPTHMLAALTEAIQEKLMYGGDVDASLLIAALDNYDIDTEGLDDLEIFQFFSFLAGRNEVADIQARVRRRPDTERPPTARHSGADFVAGDEDAPGGCGTGRTSHANDEGDE